MVLPNYDLVYPDYFLSESGNNEADLRKMSEEQFVKDFEVDESILNKILSAAEEFEVTFKANEYKRSLPLIKGFFKAELGRSLYTDETFIRIMNGVNNYPLAETDRLFDEAEGLLALTARAN